MIIIIRDNDRVIMLSDNNADYSTISNKDGMINDDDERGNDEKPVNKAGSPWCRPLHQSC